MSSRSSHAGSSQRARRAVRVRFGVRFLAAVRDLSAVLADPDVSVHHRAPLVFDQLRMCDVCRCLGRPDA